MFVTDAGSQAPAPDIAFTLDEMSRQFPAEAEPAGLRELWSIVSGAADAGGLSTRPEHFVVVDADPWVSFWRGRGGRRIPLAACGVIAWGAVTIELVRRCRRRGVR
jgi:hypothetical protein